METECFQSGDSCNERKDEVLRADLCPMEGMKSLHGDLCDDDETLVVVV